jgi:hypothetical protein
MNNYLQSYDKKILNLLIIALSAHIVTSLLVAIYLLSFLI